MLRDVLDDSGNSPVASVSTLTQSVCSDISVNSAPFLAKAVLLLTRAVVL